MSEMIELSENQLEMVAGGGPTVGSVVVQQNFNVTPQVGVSVAVAALTKNSKVNASSANYSLGVQLNGLP
jgi:hypothetical protein